MFPPATLLTGIRTKNGHNLVSPLCLIFFYLLIQLAGAPYEEFSHVHLKSA